MKAIRIIVFLAMLAMVFPSSAQERGFFHIYPLEGDIHFPLSMSMAETQNGGFVLAIDNSLGLGVPDATWKRLIILSEEGEILNSVPYGDENGMYVIFNVFRHPEDSDLYIGTGFKYTLFTTTPYEQYTAVPYFVHFDDNLNIISQHLGEWPDVYQDPVDVTGKYALLSDGKVFGVFGFELPSDTIPHHYHRLFAEMSLEGDFEFSSLDTSFLY